MTTTPLSVTAGAARQRLAASLATLQQDPNVPSNVMDIVSGVARAMGPLFQLERGSPDSTLIFTARAVLQETLSKMQSVDQNYPGVGDCTSAIAQSLGMTFTAIRDHGLKDPNASAAQVIVAPQPAPGPVTAPQPAPVAPQPISTAPAAPVVAPQPAPVVVQQPAPQPAPIPLVQPAAAPMPLVQQVAQPIPLKQAPPQERTPAFGTSKPESLNKVKNPGRTERKTVFPETAAKVPVGPNGVPRLEAEVDAHSESNFYTNFFGDIHDHGGIFVATYAALAMNSMCEVVITFPGNLTAEIRGTVRWRREVDTEANTTASPGLGVEISSASDDSWRLIERFSKKRDPLIYEA